MSTYFTNFPTVTYDNVLVRDIVRRSIFVQNLLSDPYVFLPYTVKDGEKPEDIAYNYYNTVAATWLVLLANNIVDPYTEWPMSTEMFNEYMMQKYQEASGKTGSDVLAWAQDGTSFDNIVYYYKTSTSGIDVKVSPDSFPYVYNDSSQIVGINVPEGWTPLRIYDYEYQLNEKRREILVVQNNYYQQIDQEFKRIMKK